MEKRKITWIEKHILKERMKALDNCVEFQQIFGIRMKQFWIDNICGFDVVAFDRWLNPPHDMSTSEYIKEKFGSKAVSIIKKLIR